MANIAKLQKIPFLIPEFLFRNGLLRNEQKSAIARLLAVFSFLIPNLFLSLLGTNILHINQLFMRCS